MLLGTARIEKLFTLHNVHSIRPCILDIQVNSFQSALLNIATISKISQTIASSQKMFTKFTI